MTNEILFADNLSSQPRLRHAFFTKSWGVSLFSGSEMEQQTVLARARISDYLGIQPSHFFYCRQIHSTKVFEVGDVWTPENSPRADAIITNKPGTALSVLTADCVPVLFAEPNAGVIGAAHAGWRGAVSGILENTIQAMEKLGAQRKNVIAALGPCIAQKSYEVGPEFPAPFLTENPNNKQFFKPSVRQGHFQFDIEGYVALKLRSFGVDNVSTMSVDTFAEPNRFFSHRYSILRGENRKGSLVSAIVLA